MEITLDKTSDCQASLRAAIPAAEVQEKKKSILAAYGRNARIAGFRPGKVPASVVAKHYAKEVTEQLHDELKMQAQQNTLEENPKLKVLDFANIEVHELEDGSVEITSALTLIPEFELPEYLGIEVSVPTTDVSDEEVQDTLRKYAESSATHEVVERAAAKDDIVVIDFKTTVEGKPTAEFCGKPVGFMEGRDGHWLSLSEDGFIPGWAEGLVGASAGESRDVVTKLPEDFPISELKGQEVTFSCTVKEVREKRVPEISVELFANVLPGKTMDEIREEVRTNLKAGKERSNEELKADQISEKLAEGLSFALPEEVVDRENENTVQRKVYAAIQAGNYDVSKDAETLRAEAREETVRNLRVYFALQEIAEREHVTATDAELMQAITRMAQQAKESNIKAFIRKLQRENRITGIRLSIVTSKVMDLLVRQAKVTTESPVGEAS